MNYWAVMPNYRNRESALSICRIEKASTAAEALHLAFGRGAKEGTRSAEYDIGRWLAKNLGPRVGFIQSDRKRIAALRDPTGWIDPYEYRKAQFPNWAERFRGD
jgi:hypothetical protein